MTSDHQYPIGASQEELELVDHLRDLAERTFDASDRYLITQAVSQITRMIEARNRFRAYEKNWEKEDREA